MTTTDADPLAPPSSRFALTGSSFTPVPTDEPSPPGVRPWGLRRARPGQPGRTVPAWRYDHDRQLAVLGDGETALIDVVCGDPSADTTSTTDGEDGPSAEDWNND